MRKSPQPGTGKTIFLYIFGIFFLLSAIVVILKGTGILGWIPNYLIWALVLVSIGSGILAGIKNVSDRR
ncbi:hypothetical protein JJD41_18660 [Oxynema sp. CENA135]|uniref:hypothetical protein n=1 Tax=Oxynema sp. CENA135 TaxID=984206 RepID=UPI00190D1853|nr:hypothetical protein [Oxynema sp. CENA135]MBK4731876.1 hypothetical protein [Oxynema sp. CENA135]